MKQHKQIQLINDDYFAPRHWILKIQQTCSAIIGWLGVIFPFFWVLIPLWQPRLAVKLHIAHYSDEIQLLKFLAYFFGGFFIFISVLYIGVTFWNNHHFQYTLERYKVPNQKQQKTRETLIEQAWQQRFGDYHQRHQARFYSVKPTQNLDTHFTKKLFQKDEAAK